MMVKNYYKFQIFNIRKYPFLESLIGVRKKVKVVLSSDEEETDFKNIPSSSAADPRKTVKRVSSDLDSTFFEHQPAKKPKKKVSVCFSSFALNFINEIYFCRKNQDFFFLKPVSRVTTLAMMILLKWIIMMLVSSKNNQRKVALSNFGSIFLAFVTINNFY